MTYTLSGLPRALFAPYFAMSEDELARAGARRVIADSDRGFPCRIGLRDARVGERLILLQYVSHDVPGPYRSAYAIYVSEEGEPAAACVDALPDYLDRRPLSLRGFDEDGMVVIAVLSPAGEGDMAIRLLFADTRIAYILAHFAAYGCFAARIERDSVQVGEMA
jgi:hypothetical protein